MEHYGYNKNLKNMVRMFDKDAYVDGAFRAYTNNNLSSFMACCNADPKNRSYLFIHDDWNDSIHKLKNLDNLHITEKKFLNLLSVLSKNKNSISSIM